MYVAATCRQKRTMGILCAGYLRGNGLMQTNEKLPLLLAVRKKRNSAVAEKRATISS